MGDPPGRGAGITRQLMIGAILIVMMNARPQGLLGSRRVEALT
jgi:ABC-type branched-subunit amino acid transport system permease subunit